MGGSTHLVVLLLSIISVHLQKPGTVYLIKAAFYNKSIIATKQILVNPSFAN